MFYWGVGVGSINDGKAENRKHHKIYCTIVAKQRYNKSSTFSSTRNNAIEPITITQTFVSATNIQPHKVISVGHLNV